ncbi:MAG: beta-propeller domain-containing protein [Oligoflexales bacterium]
MKTVIQGLILLLVTSCHSSSGKDAGNGDVKVYQDPKFRVTAELEKFVNCSEITRYIEERTNVPNAYPPMAQGEEMSDSSEGAKTTYTNVQEVSVDEGDRVKIDENFIYAVSPGFINIIKRDTLEVAGSVELLDGAYEYPVLYSSNDRLAVIEQSDKGTNLRIFHIDAAAKSDLILEKTYKGQYRESRFSAGNILIAVNDYIVDYPNDQPEINLGADIECSDVVRPFIDDMSWGMTKVFSINLTSPEEEFKTAFLGGTEYLYMSEDSIYLTRSGSPWSSDGNYEISTVVARVAFDKTSGNIAPVSAGIVPGYVVGQWAFKEFADQGVVAVATTTYAPVGDPDTPVQNKSAVMQGTGERNHLWILEEKDETLSEVARIADFAPNEDIRAVRYVGSMAYVVTFEKTDPLFAFDLSNAREPKLVSELKIPGFSMYLHPLSETELLGVGYDGDDQGDFSWFQGVQVSLFDVANPSSISRSDVAILGKRGSFTDVTGDHKAFLFDKESGLVGLPVTVYEGQMTGGSEQATDLTFSGAIFYKPENGLLNEVGRVTHSDLIPSACKNIENYHWWGQARRSLDVNRLFRVDNRILTFSRFGLKAFDMAMNAETTVKFSGAKEDCGTYGWSTYTYPVLAE